MVSYITRICVGGISTSDDIEMRLCSDQDRNDEDITFEIIELYVQ